MTVLPLLKSPYISETPNFPWLVLLWKMWYGRGGIPPVQNRVIVLKILQVLSAFMDTICIKEALNWVLNKQFEFLFCWGQKRKKVTVWWICLVCDLSILNSSSSTAVSSGKEIEHYEQIINYLLSPSLGLSNVHLYLLKKSLFSAKLSER